jgi:hypothetical protein
MIRNADKAAAPKRAAVVAGGVTCETQKFEQTVRNLLNTPHRPHQAGEKTKEAASKGDLKSRKGAKG